MALKITCPSCGRVHRLRNPYPPPGSELQCHCGRVLALSFSPQAMARIRARGETFLDQPRRLSAQNLEPERPPAPPAPAPMNWSAPLPDYARDPEERGTVVERADMDEEAPTVMEDVPPHLLADEAFAEPPPPPPVSLPRATPSYSNRAPSRPPEAYRLSQPSQTPDPNVGGYRTPAPSYPPRDPSYPPRQPYNTPVPPPAGYSTPPQAGYNTPPPPAYGSAIPPQASGIGAASPAAERSGVPTRSARQPPGKRKGWRLPAPPARLGVLGLVGGAAAGFGTWYFSQGLPAHLGTLANCRPPTVTIVKGQTARCYRSTSSGATSSTTS
ncbi:MAG: hypothetical protein H6741_10935 [Alphaproteobacteria bacterium]|nr:hypothetical protein [Alphaproteobacteria bacterium]